MDIKNNLRCYKNNTNKVESNIRNVYMNYSKNLKKNKNRIYNVIKKISY